MRELPIPRLLPTTMAMIVVVIVAKAVVLMHGVMDHSLTAPPLLTPAQAADHLQETPKPVATATKPAAPAHGGQAAKPAGGSPADAAADGAAAMSDSEKALLLTLRQRSRDLDARAKALNEREAVLLAAEKKLDNRVAEMKSLQKRLESLNTEQKQKAEAGWQSMVKLYEAMKPRDAAAILNDLALPVVLQVVNRMKDMKAAAILSAMTPEKARDITAGLAQMRTGRDLSGNPTTASGG